MGLFSNPKCPIHRIEYKIGTDGLTDHYYCPKCRDEAAKKRRFEERVERLEKMVGEK
jgi:NADH:ubiquinone oxidoreductase subunit